MVSHFDLYFSLIRQGPSADTYWQFIFLMWIACYFYCRDVLSFPRWLVRGLCRILLGLSLAQLSTTFHYPWAPGSESDPLASSDSTAVLPSNNLSSAPSSKQTLASASLPQRWSPKARWASPPPRGVQWELYCISPVLLCSRSSCGAQWRHIQMPGPIPECRVRFSGHHFRWVRRPYVSKIWYPYKVTSVPLSSQ